MPTKKKHNPSEKKQESNGSPEESLKKLIDDARTKSEAYKKILKSLNTNKNRD